MFGYISVLCNSLQLCLGCCDCCCKYWYKCLLGRLVSKGTWLYVANRTCQVHC